VNETKKCCAPIHGVGAGVGLLILGAGYLVGVAPALKAKERLGSDRETLAVMRTELDAAEERVRTMRQAHESAKAELDRSEIAMRPESDRNEVIGELAGFAERQRLTLNQIRAGRLETGKPISVVPIIMSGTCSFADFDQTLSTLREEFPDVRIRSFSIARTLARTEQQPVFEFQLAWCIESRD
jgi:HAMP domain-containing protein